MLEKLTENDTLIFQSISPEEKKTRGILGRLSGPVASFMTPTRNGRKYTDDLWESVFKSDIVQEMFENGGLPGELSHPIDRSETDPEKIAIMMSEPPKKDNNGHLVAYVDILDTPCGKIAYQLAKYGFKFGISSRGEGEVFEDWDGQETVDKNTYTLNAFDLVLLPACKDARLVFNESYNDRNKSFKKSLLEELESASSDDRKIMEDTLKELQIDYSPEKVDNKDEVKESNKADDDGISLVQELQEALKKNRELESKLTSLQEKLSVSYTKEADLRDTIAKYKSSIISLTENSKKSKVLESKISELTETVSSKEETIKKQQATIERLNESRKSISSKSKSLNESLASKDAKITSLEKQVHSLNESIRTINAQNNKAKETLTENIEELKKDSAIKHSEYTKKLTRANQLVERYKKFANESISRYISSQANRLGVSTSEIKNKLSEGFSFEDIDRVCEELQDYKINISKLPFDISKTKNVRMKVTESVEPIKPANRFSDEIDDQLKSLAGL